MHLGWRRTRLLVVALAICLLAVCFVTAVVTAVPVPVHAHVSPKAVATTSSAAAAVHADGSRVCVLDHATPMDVADIFGVRYLVYAPPLGVGQPVALRHAIAWAVLLNRTLVLPHLLGRSSSSSSGGGGGGVTSVKRDMTERSYLASTSPSKPYMALHVFDSWFPRVRKRPLGCSSLYAKRQSAT